MMFPRHKPLYLTVGNKHFYSCGGMKNDMRHAVPMAEMRKAYRLVAENLNARDQEDFIKSILNLAQSMYGN